MEPRHYDLIAAYWPHNPLNKKSMQHNPRSKKGTPTKYGPSKTIPGQSLKPAELLKRHLAGTLPPIDLSGRMEYHYDETGKQVAEPLPLEMHEMHKLSVAIRKRQYEEALEYRKKQLEKHKKQILDEYLKQQEDAKKKASENKDQPDPKTTKPTEGNPDQKSTPKGGRDR